MPTREVSETKRDRSGDKLFVVEREHSFAHQEDNSRDAIRYILGSYWNSSFTNGVVDRRPTMQKEITGAGLINWKLVNPTTNQYPSTEIRKPGSITEIIRVKPRARPNEAELRESSNFKEEAKMLKKFLKSFTGAFGEEKKRTFQDHAVEFNTYERNSNEKEEQRGLLNLYMSVEPYYNYYEAQYETMMVERADSITEADLPSFYNIVFNGGGFSFPGDEDSSYSNPSSNAASILSLYNNVLTPSAMEIIDVSVYLRDWSLTFPSIARERSDRLKRVYFTKEETEKINESAKYREMMPMYTRIQFQTEIESGIGTTLAETNYFSKIRNFISRAVPERIETYEVVSTLPEYNLFMSPIGSSIPEKVRLHTRSYYDVDEFFEKHLDIEPMDSFYFSENPSENMNDNRYRAYYTIMSAIAKAKVESIKNNKLRSWKDTVGGKLAHSETVMYTIRKYDANDQLIQSYYLTNSDKLKNIDFIDSQVMYGKKYRYELSAIKLIVGSEYTYKYLSQDLHGTTFEIKTVPSIKLCEISLLSDTAIILDNPPMPPDIEIIPTMGSTNSIEVHLNTSIGRAMMKPIYFTSEEHQDIDIIRKAQKLDHEEILYETDDPITEYEIYRLDNAPSSYADFYSFGKRSLSRTVLESGVATSTVFKDKIEANTKYYYCARSIDNHAHISNPSMVWQVELVSEGGATYPIIREYPVVHESQNVPTKSFRRFIQISPTAMQRVVNDATSGIVDNKPTSDTVIKLGDTESALWDKKFKLRLTSKTTGRKIDFNFTFKVKKME